MRGRCLVSSVPLWRSHGQLRSANAFANPTANRLAHSGGPQPSGVGAARSLPPQHAQLAAPAPTVPTAGAQTGPTARGMRGPPDMPGLLACRFSVRGVLWAWGSGAPFSHQCHRDLSHICVPFLSKVPPDQGRLSRGSCPARGQFPERGGQPLCVRVTGWSRPGARCRHCCWSVSPGRSPNPPCGFHRNGLSMVPVGGFVQAAWTHGLGILVPR